MKSGVEPFHVPVRCGGLDPTTVPTALAARSTFSTMPVSSCSSATFLRTEPDCRGLVGFYSWSTKLGRP
eukprot:CAMPEP_0181202240 /NCGR_PEP_ID=MMETSP1096-20121128/18734_1 /TAXON_ID=156174 ORGANISM="Chrysochromulina ericina, Strain CCMP281" /NCGR_SAMPLE_ID=MMETSP1096 /ASSEMBLY_ACC=CAM_ASM_000453 /LENGTH=68 /DNA_ID=CAMNT_0023292735 /DNA_START=507 /DNA_END=713 /DNA_ORIENTATION=+